MQNKTKLQHAIKFILKTNESFLANYFLKIRLKCLNKTIQQNYRSKSYLTFPKFFIRNFHRLKNHLYLAGKFQLALAEFLGKEKLCSYLIQKKVIGQKMSHKILEQYGSLDYFAI